MNNRLQHTKNSSVIPADENILDTEKCIALPVAIAYNAKNNKDIYYIGILKVLKQLDWLSK